MITNNLRFSGLASGIDTEALVTKLMDAEKIQLNKVLQNKTKTGWKIDAYRDVNAKFLELRSSMENLRLESTFKQSKLTSSDTSKVDVSLTGVPSRSEYIISAAKAFQPGTPSSIKFAPSSISGDQTEFGAGKGFSFTLNNETVELTGQDSIRSSITKINALADKTGVTASYSSGDQAIVFTSKNAGTSISIANLSGSNVLNIAAGTVSGTQNDFPAGNLSGATGHSGAAAVDGEVTINGTALTLKSNQLTYDGISFTIKSDIPVGSSPITINKKTDVDSIFDRIKNFVDTYNDTIKTLHDKVDEKKYKDFAPLIDDQKKDMKEKEIELWEEKAKSGLLQDDRTISAALDKMRRTLYSPVSDSDPTKLNSQLDSFAEIGITSSSNYKENGKLIIDEKKLREVLENNIDDVSLLFSKKHDTDKAKTTVNSAEEFKYSGVGWRLYDQINESMKEITKTAGYSNDTVLAKALSQMDDQIDSWEKRLQTKESYYWKQFTAMEQAIQKANSQSGWLMQQMGGGM